jgi:glycosyltransferase involved in cell wall biosynthesis
MKVLHILYSGLGGHGNVFFSMVDGDTEKMNNYEAIFFGIEDVREGYITKAVARNIPWHFVKKKAGFDFKAYREIEKIIKQSQPGIVFLHTSAYIFPAKKAALASGKKIKIVVRETQPNHLKTKLEWIGLSFALLFAGKVVFLSTEYRDAIKKKLWLLFSNKRTAVIPNGVDLNVYKPVVKAASLPFIKIGMQSRLSETKDHATLIEAFAILIKKNQFEKPVKLMLAGDGNCRSALEKQAAALGIHNKIEFTGMLEEAQLPGFINDLDIYVHATLGETMSTAIMQVMACRLPIVASDVLGVNNMIKHNQNGLLVPAKDPEKLSQAMALLIQDTTKAGELAGNAFTFATENYSNKKMLNSYNTIFKALVSE